MYFIETPLFTKAIQDLLPDTDYRALQSALMLRPEQGVMIKGSGGLRKIRWSVAGRGKRGGLRIIYYWHQGEGTLYMLWAYPKGVQDDLTQRQLNILSRAVREEFK